MRCRSRVLGFALLLTLLGCSTEGKHSPEGEPALPSSSAFERTAQGGSVTAADRRRLERGIQPLYSNLASGRGIDFTFRLGPEATPLHAGSGAYAANPGRYEATLVMDGSGLGVPGPPMTMRVRSAGRGL